MFILTGSRASGKTYNLLRECNNNNGVVLVKSKPDAVIMKEYAERLGFKNVKVMSYLSFAESCTVISPVYIDSIEDFFAWVIPGRIAGVASNKAEVISLNPYRVIEEDESEASIAFKGFKGV